MSGVRSGQYAGSGASTFARRPSGTQTLPERRERAVGSTSEPRHNFRLTVNPNYSATYQRYAVILVSVGAYLLPLRVTMAMNSANDLELLSLVAKMPRASLEAVVLDMVPRLCPRTFCLRPIGATVARQIPVLKVTRSNRVSVTR